VEYKLPKENQVWIINDLIPNDKKKFSELNHTNTFYLILTCFIGKPEIKVTLEKHEIKTEQITNEKSNTHEIKKEQITNVKSVEINKNENLHSSNQLQWSCEICTYLNHPKRKICQMCHTKKTDQDFNAEKNNYLKQRTNSFFNLFDFEEINKIKCNKCKCENSIYSPICDFCMVPLPYQKEQTKFNNFKRLNRQNSKSLTNLNKKYKSIEDLNKSEDD
jgi:hypothetical protein